MKSKIIIGILAITVDLLLSSCSGGSDSVKIGEQEWMTKNLNVDKFRNGDPIPEAKTKDKWLKAGENKLPAWCYYDNDPANGKKYGYGKLYNWYAVNDSRGLAPEGWHVPSDAEWTTLTSYLGGKDVAGDKMKSIHGWKDNGNGTNESGFDGLPGGSRGSVGGYNYIGYLGGWWSSTQDSTSNAWGRSLGYNASYVGRANGSKVLGFSVRCLRD